MATKKNATEDTMTAFRRNLELDGIRKQRADLQARLDFLNEYERKLVGNAMTGTPEKAVPATTGTTKRTRTLTPKQRKAMSDAAKRRWDKVRESKETTTATAAPQETAPIPPNPLT